MGEFLELKGVDYSLLKILFELILIISLIIISLCKKEILDSNQRRIEDYYKKKKNIRLFSIIFIFNIKRIIQK